MKLAAFDSPFPKTLPQAQKSRKNLLRKPSYSPFCPKFCCHGNQEKGKGTGNENGEGKGEEEREGKGKDKWKEKEKGKEKGKG